MTSVTARGWHARAVPHPNRDVFTPSPENLVFVAKTHGVAEQNGFVMALFHPDIAVDACGRVLQLRPRDFHLITWLTDEASRLPPTGRNCRAWWIAQNDSRQTDSSTEIYARTSAGEMRGTAVSGWHPRRTLLQWPRFMLGAPRDRQHLPPVVHELVGYVVEGREGYKPRGGGAEKERSRLVDRIKGMANIHACV